MKKLLGFLLRPAFSAIYGMRREYQDYVSKRWLRSEEYRALTEAHSRYFPVAVKR